MIDESHFPALYRAADHNSLDGQRRFLNATRVRLVMLVAATLVGLFSWRAGGVELAALLAAVAFSIAIVCEVYLLSARPDRLWYDGRAAAESAKTLAWRYLVGGSPLGKEELSDEQAEDQLLKRFNDVAHELKGVHLVPVSGGGDQISAEMRRCRSLSLEGRREEYRVGRIHNQRDWYARKARWNEQRATQWSITFTILEALGLVAAVLRAAGVMPVDVLGLAGALTAAGVAWVQTKQHQTLASAYAVASQELSDISSRINQPSAEREWAHFVDEAEQAISREHTLWRVSRS
jgi:hypothetical protein